MEDLNKKEESVENEASTKEEMAVEEEIPKIEATKQHDEHPDIEKPDMHHHSHTKFGIGVLVVVFGLIILWSTFARLDTGVQVPGKVIVATDKQIVQHLESGIVEDFFVHDGDHVQKDEPLLKLNEVKEKSALKSYEAKYYEALALEARLVAESREMDNVKFPSELDNLSSERKNRLIKIQNEIFHNEMESLKKRRKVTDQNIESLNEQIHGLEDVIHSKENLLKSFQDEADEQQSLFENRLIDKKQLREVNRKIEQTKSDILTNKTDIMKAKIQIRQATTELAVKEEDFFAKVRKNLQDTRTTIDDMQAKITEVNDKLLRSTVKAPVSGYVVNMAVHTIGAVITPGKPIMEIVPENSELIIDAKLPPQYIDYARVGLKANMTFPAFQMKGRFIKNITGEVIYVASDSITDEKGNSYYTVRLKVDKEGIEILKKEHLSLQPGMPASVVIKIGSQTPIEYLLKPLTMMLNKAFLEE